MARDYPDTYEPIPVDRVAGRVLSTGYHHEFKKKSHDREVWDVPPETVALYLVPPQVRELFGTRKGALMVVGYLGKNICGGNKKQRLLVRCDCGRYEVRIAQKWRKSGNEIFERCQFCDQREDLKISHLPYSERDRLEDLKRVRHGLPTRDEEMLQRLQRKIVNSYLAPSKRPIRKKAK